MGWLFGVGALVVAFVVAISGARDQTRALKSTRYADRFTLPGKARSTRGQR